METLRNFVRTLGPVRLAVLGGVTVALAAFFVWIVAKSSAPQHALLYSDLDLAEAGKIATQLEASGIPYDVRNGGTAVFVPVEQVGRVRVALAEKGLPAGGSVGFEIFDTTSALGSTSFQQNVNLTRALEGELARTIRSIDSVKSARVHLVLPRQETFSRDKKEASASVLLQMRGRGRLSPSQVAAVQQLVASAVPGLSANHISIIDGQGTLLSEDLRSDDVSAAAARTEQRRRQVETHLSSTVEQLLERIVGPGRVRAEISADMDFDRINTSEEIFNPDGQVVRSTQSVQQNNSNRDSQTDQSVSVSTNLPDAKQDGGAASGSSSSESRNEETVNYEISKKVINHVREAGVIRRLSVAVLVDGTYVNAADGARTYQARSAEELEQLANLVRGATGYDAARGDKVDVISMRFAEPEVIPEDPGSGLLGLEKSDLIRLGEYLALVVLALLVLLLVIKPIISKAIEVAPAPAARPDGGLLGGPAAHLAIAGPDGSLAAAQAGMALTAAGGAAGAGGAVAAGGDDGVPDEMINLDRIEGRVKASSLKRVGAIVERHPEESLAIVRNWLHSDN